MASYEAPVPNIIDVTPLVTHTANSTQKGM